jgi:hypothetical protein
MAATTWNLCLDDNVNATDFSTLQTAGAVAAFIALLAVDGDQVGTAASMYSAKQELQRILRTNRENQDDLREAGVIPQLLQLVRTDSGLGTDFDGTSRECCQFALGALICLAANNSETLDALRAAPAALSRMQAALVAQNMLHAGALQA